MTLAQAVGEAPPSPLSFVPGVDFDPYDEDERETVRLAMDRDMADRLRATQQENARLRLALERAEEENARLQDP